MDGAALSYAETKVPFEEVRKVEQEATFTLCCSTPCMTAPQVALKFVNSGEKHALKSFVKIKLGRFAPEVRRVGLPS